MRLGLGTAQFGMEYGVSNRVGQTPPDEVAAILGRALEAGVRIIDTAAAYGTAERVVGDTGLAGSFDVVTKTPPRPSADAGSCADGIEKALLRSLERLGLDSVYGFLVHAVTDLTGDDGAEVAARLVSLREQGLVGRIGVSVYSADEIRLASDAVAPEIVQLPLSVYDQRLLADGTLARLVREGVEVHTRSALLQGVLAMTPDELPAHLAGLKAHHVRYAAEVADLGLAPVDAALGFALGVQGPAAVVVGVNTLAQLEDLLDVAPLESGRFARWAIDDVDLVNPARWERS